GAMHFSQYKSKKKPAKKKNRLNGQNTKKLRKGVIRFLILAGIVVSVIPFVYFSDNVYRLASRKPVKQRIAAQTSWSDRHFTVQSVRITGNNFVTMEELSPYLQRVKGNNIFKLDIADMANRLRNNPWIKDVSVRRELPSSIAINIVERTPAVYINSKNGLYLSDEEGILLGEKGASSFGLPVVYGISLEGTGTGEKTNSEALFAAIRIKKELSSIPWIELPLTGIEVDGRSDITLHMRGYRIKLGHDRYKDKLRRFNEIARDLNGKGIPYKEVDLRFDNQVVVQTL
ncbi:MAG: FtsQ-type POTRA domain-containing protein, partial [Nitrospirota bacterium]